MQILNMNFHFQIEPSLTGGGTRSELSRLYTSPMRCVWGTLKQTNDSKRRKVPWDMDTGKAEKRSVLPFACAEKK